MAWHGDVRTGRALLESNQPPLAYAFAVATAPMIPHLTPWAGAMAGLRLNDMMLAAFAVCSYAHVFVRMLRRGFMATGTDVLGGFAIIVAASIFMHGLTASRLIISRGGVPADAISGSGFLWPYLGYNLALTILFAGLTTRAGLRRGLPHRIASRQGRLTYLRIAIITGLMMATGAALMTLHVR